MLGPDRPVFHRPATAAKGGCAPPVPDQLAAVRQFVARVGGIENARRALEMLKLLKRTG